MARQRRVTLVELLVVAGLVAIVVHTVLHMETRTRDHRRYSMARIALCMANLKQWSLIFSMYTEDNDGHFFSGQGANSGRWWIDPLRQYYKDTAFWLCPAARKPYAEPGHSVVGAWKTADDVGSCGLDGWVCNPQEGETPPLGLLSAEYCWRNTRFENANRIPVFLDALWFEGWPRHTDTPPYTEDWLGSSARQVAVEASTSQMSRFCVNRHGGYVNVMFLDWSVRGVGLKELWTLKWHRDYNIDGPWTKAGGVLPADWPQWMRDFKDY